MLIQLGNTKEQEILRKARFSCQSAEPVQCSESFTLYRSERIGDCDAEKCCIYEYEKRSGIFAGYAVKLI